MGELTYTDINTGEIIAVPHNNLVGLGNSTIVFSADYLTPNRHYNVSIEASNVAGSAISLTTLSKLK